MLRRTFLALLSAFSFAPKVKAEVLPPPPRGPRGTHINDYVRIPGYMISHIYNSNGSDGRYQAEEYIRYARTMLARPPFNRNLVMIVLGPKDVSWRNYEYGAISFKVPGFALEMVDAFVFEEDGKRYWLKNRHDDTWPTRVERI